MEGKSLKEWHAQVDDAADVSNDRGNVNRGVVMVAKTLQVGKFISKIC